MADRPPIGYNTSVATDYKAAAIKLWTQDPCGPVTPLEPGTPAYFEQLRASRADQYHWLAEVLDYPGARGLDVLDVGCGQGTDLYHYASHGARATGVDLTPRHVELARRHVATANLEATVIVGDAERLPFDDGSFDRASSNGVLHHTPDMPRALREIHRVLRPGGRAVIIVYHRDSAHFWIQQMLVAGILQGKLLRARGSVRRLLEHVEYSSTGDDHPLVNVYSKRKLRRMMQEAGFGEVVVRESPWHPSDTSLRIGMRRFGWFIAAIAHR